ncbi:hypothetical protein ACX0HA_13795 [Flavobacterium hauense]
MDTSDKVALLLGGIGFIISIINFVITPIINLKSKRLEKRLDYRFQLFEKILELWETTNQPVGKQNIEPLLIEINKSIQLYGYNSEIKHFNKLVAFYNYYAQNQNDDNLKKLKIKLSEFFSTSFNTYRKEIALDKLPKN